MMSRSVAGMTSRASGRRNGSDCGSAAMGMRGVHVEQPIAQYPEHPQLRKHFK